MWPSSQHLGRAIGLERGIHGENPNPTTADFSDDLQWVENYLYIHQLSGQLWSVTAPIIIGLMFLGRP